MYSGNGIDRSKSRLLSVRQAAAYLNMSIWTMRDRIANGKIPAVRDGRLVKLDIQDLDQWIESHKERLIA